MPVGSRFQNLSTRFIQTNVKKRAFNRFIHRHFCNITSSEYLRKLKQQKLTSREVEHLIRDRGIFEERLSILEQRLDGSNSERLHGVSAPKHQNPLMSLRQSGGSRAAPLFIERVGEKKWQSFFTTIVFWVILLSLWFHFQKGQNNIQNMFDDNYTEYDEIHWEDDENDPDSPGLDPGLVDSKKQEEPKGWRDRILSLFGISVTDDSEAAQGKGKSRKRTQKRTTFENVCGCEEAKEDLQDMVYYLKHPEEFRTMGIKLPKGVLLEGPPGTGKTMMARALAGEAGVPFLATNGSAFDQIFVGVGVMRVKNLFERAKELAPCIIFIDEIDAIGSSRGGVSVSPHASDSLNALLVEMDGFEENNGVIVIAATNMAHKLDHALVRAGRFDRTIRVGLPDRRQRADIIELYMKDKGDDTVDINTLVSDLAGFSGADLANIVNLAGIEAVKAKRQKITMHDLVEAKETVSMGRARKSMVVPQKEKELTAYHEGGHAIVALFTEGANPIYKATLMPRGPALGMVSFTTEDEFSKTREALLAQLDVGMGGRAAEELIFGSSQVTTGASSDFNQCTNIATAMVTQFGMSDKVGKVFYERQDIEKLSPELQNLINSETKILLDESYERAMNTLKKHRDKLEMLAQELLQEETLGVKEIKRLVGFEDTQRESPFKFEKYQEPGTRTREGRLKTSDVGTPNPVPASKSSNDGRPSLLGLS